MGQPVVLLERCRCLYRNAKLRLAYIWVGQTMKDGKL